MLPIELSSTLGEGLSDGLVIPQVVKLLLGSPVGKNVEEAQENPVSPARGRHDAPFVLLPCPAPSSFVCKEQGLRVR
jgi:hypothetical protein